MANTRKDNPFKQQQIVVKVVKYFEELTEAEKGKDNESIM